MGCVPHRMPMVPSLRKPFFKVSCANVLGTTFDVKVNNKRKTSALLLAQRIPIVSYAPMLGI
jgi:hypothetical protein